MRQHGRVYDKKYKILRFDIYAQKHKHKKDHNKIQWEYLGEYNDFQIALINEFCTKPFEFLEEFYYTIDPATGRFNRYDEKKLLYLPQDIGLDMISEATGLVKEYQWMYVYFKIPIENTALIEFFDKQKFSFDVKEVQTI